MHSAGRVDVLNVVPVTAQRIDRAFRRAVKGVIERYQYPCGLLP